MLKTVEGFYQNGQVQLTEPLQDLSDRTQVLVTFLEPGKVDSVKLRQWIDQLETIAGIQQGLEELEAGQTRPMNDFIQGMQQKYEDLNRQAESFATGLQKLGKASSAEVQAVLAEREMVEPEQGLSAEVIDRLQQHIDSQTSSSFS